ncbi:MAG: septum formation initiator family protein [Pseudomonadota bacterium]
MAVKSLSMDRIAAGTLCTLIVYFAYHAFAGEAGLGEYADMQTELAEKQATLAALQSEILRLETDIRRLTPETADPDHIEALAREKLAFVFPDELVLVE